MYFDPYARAGKRSGAWMSECCPHLPTQHVTLVTPLVQVQGAAQPGGLYAHREQQLQLHAPRAR